VNNATKDKKSIVTPRESKLNQFLSQINRSFAISKKNVKIYYNKGPVAIQGIAFPIILFFAFTIGRQIEPPHVVSGLVSLIIFLTSTSIAPIVFPWETRDKTLEKLITCPISIKTIVLGDIWGSFFFGVLFSIFPLIIGIVLLSLWNALNIGIMIVAIIVAAFAFSCFSSILSVPPSDTPSYTMILTIIVKFPLIFLSGIFGSIESAPYSVLSPVTYFTDIINFGFTGSSAFGPLGVLLDFAVLLTFGFGFLGLSLYFHGKVLQRRFTA